MSAPDGELSGRRVLLTGATSGIGRAIGDRLAAAGAGLVIVGRRADRLAELAKRWAARSLAGDLADREFIGQIPGRLPADWEGGPDALINNAGVFEIASLEQTSVEVFEAHLAVNLRAPFELARAWLPGMVQRASGHVVNIGSVAGRRGFPGNAAYSASKFGLRGLHEVLVEELRGTGVRVTWIEPSAVDTPLWDPFDPDGRPDLPSRSEMLAPQSIAEAVHFALVQPSTVNVQEIVLRSNVRSRTPS